MYKRASRFGQSLVRRGNRETGGRNLVMSDSRPSVGKPKSPQIARLDKEVERASRASTRGTIRLVKRPKSVTESN
jgi:hypothetical protein